MNPRHHRDRSCSCSTARIAARQSKNEILKAVIDRPTVGPNWPACLLWIGPVCFGHRARLRVVICGTATCEPAERAERTKREIAE